jgi:lipopolysaccharide/colanic/teichoic acid biosynthesis glycosyltransferase
MRRAARPLLYVGVLAVVLTLAKVHARYIGHYDLTGSARFGWTVAYAGILCVCAYGAGLPEMPRTRRVMLGTSVGAAFAGAAAMSIVQLFAGDALLPRFVVFGAALVLPDWYRLCARLASGERSRAEARDRVALVSGEDEAAALRQELSQSPERPASLVVHLTIDAAQPVGEVRPLIDTCAQATVLVLDRTAQADDAVIAQAAILHERGMRVRTLTSFYEDWLGKLPMSELERASMLFDIGELHGSRYGRVKRIVDVALAGLGVIPLAIVVPLVAIANLAGNRGPLLYRQPRVGRGGATFTIIKLRTMRPAVDGGLVNEWTSEDDPRITRVGRILRLTHLDELPQVVNILRGDLSVVGPRPEQPGYVADLSEKLAFYRLRHTVRPGLTGWAQVKYGYAGNETDALEKLQYEFWYLRHQSLRLDLRIVGRTLRSVLGRGGR